MSKTGSQLTNNITIDGSRKSVQTSGSFAVADATGTPIVSPKAYTNSVITLVVPDNAIEFVVAPSTALRVSDAVAMTNYYVVAASTAESFPCAKMQNIYITRDSADGTAQFRFNVL